MYSLNSSTYWEDTLSRKVPAKIIDAPLHRETILDTNTVRVHIGKLTVGGDEVTSAARTRWSNPRIRIPVG